MTSDDQKRLSKIFCLVDVLIGELDTPSKTPTKQTKEVLNKSKELQELLTPILDRFYENKQVQISVFFQTMSKKIEYIFDKEYKKIK